VVAHRLKVFVCCRSYNISQFLLTYLTLRRPLLPYGYIYKHPVPDRVNPRHCVIFDIRALWRSALSVSVIVPGCQNLQMTA